MAYGSTTIKKASIIAKELEKVMIDMCKKYNAPLDELESTAYFYARKFTELMTKGMAQTSIEVWAKADDGTIHYGLADQYMVNDLCDLMSQYSIGNDDKDKDRVLLKSDMTYSFCEETKQFYSGIEPLIGRYLMRHKCSHFIFDVLTGVIDMEEVKGIREESFKLFLKAERNIIKKARIIMEPDDLWDLKESSDNYRVQLFNRFHYDKRYENMKKSNRLTDLLSIKAKCKDEELLYTDVLERMMNGCGLDIALEECKKEMEKYGFEHINNANSATGCRLSYDADDLRVKIPKINYNLYRYIKYVAKQEELGLGE